MSGALKTRHWALLAMLSSAWLLIGMAGALNRSRYFWSYWGVFEWKDFVAIAILPALGVWALGYPYLRMAETGPDVLSGRALFRWRMSVLLVLWAIGNLAVTLITGDRVDPEPWIASLIPITLAWAIGEVYWLFNRRKIA